MSDCERRIYHLFGTPRVCTNTPWTQEVALYSRPKFTAGQTVPDSSVENTNRVRLHVALPHRGHGSDLEPHTFRHRRQGCHFPSTCVPRSIAPMEGSKKTASMAGRSKAKISRSLAVERKAGFVCCFSLAFADGAT